MHGFEIPTSVHLQRHICAEDVAHRKYGPQECFVNLFSHAFNFFYEVHQREQVQTNRILVSSVQT